MEKLIHVEGNDLVVRFVLSDDEIEFMFKVAEAENYDLGSRDRNKYASLFDGGLVVFDEYSSNEFGGAYLSDLGLESLDYFK